MSSIEVSRVTIIKSFDDEAEGSTSIVTEYTDGLTLLDALGMIAFAQATTVDNYKAEE